MDRRAHPRQPISLGALVHPQQGRSWLCTIRDFCQGGMLLVGSGGSRSLAATGANVLPGDAISLHFSVPTETGEEHVRMQALVCRVLDSGAGMGIRFASPMQPTAFDALMSYAAASGMVARSAADLSTSKQPAAEESAKDQPGDAQMPDGFLRDKRINEADAKKIRAQLKRIMSKAGDRISKAFFDRCEKVWLERARDAGTNAVQMMYFEGLDQLEKSKEDIGRKFSSVLLAQIDKVSDLDEVLEKRRRRETGNSNKLQLVDAEEFEDWLAIAEVISKAENRCTDALLDIRVQLGMVAKPWGHKDVVPVGPAVIAWAFDDALVGIDVRRQIRQEAYQEFQAVLIPILTNLYSALLKMFEDSGVFPSLEELRTAMSKMSVRKPPAPAGGGGEVADYQDLEPAVREAAMAADGIQTAPGATANPFVARSGGTAEVYKAARELLSMGRRAREQKGVQEDVKLVPADAPPEQRFDTGDIMDALVQIERELGDAPLTDERLKPRLIEVLSARHGDTKAFGEDLYDTLDVMENLVDSIGQDHFLTDGIREWVKRLEITLNKLATRDPEFLDHEPDSPHSAVTVLNQLARLGNAKDVRVGVDREVGRRVDELLHRVVEEFDANPEVFNDVLDELTPLVDRQNRAYRGNVERTVRSSEGQQKLARARRAVVDTLEPRLGGRDVPELLLKLLNPGWRNLLVHTHLRHGAQSNEWRDALVIVEQVQSQLDGTCQSGDDDFVEPESLLKRIIEGLNSISFEPGKRTPLVMALSDVLVGDTTGAKAEVTKTRVPEGGTAEALGLAGMLPETNPAVETDDEAIKNDWDKALDRARRINVGEWLAMTDDQGRPLILSVAFVGDEQGVFVLVNRKGVKSAELVLREMADGLHEGRITLLDDYDLPLMERASQRMLQNMHNQLTYQASHDELTSLANRKEFERSLETAIAEARSGSSQHMLLYLDLDQFKIVNNTSGHTAGDELLKLVGTRLAETVAERDATVARLGGDEFGVLVKDIDTEAARIQADDLLKVIREQRFDWEGRQYSLSASVGLVFVDEGTEDPDAAMRAADEACYAAKDGGRNRVQEYELGDANMMRRRGVMQWVTQLDQAVDDGRLILNCQRISPIQIGEDSPLGTHYEILLTMQDDLGDVMPPSEFILAAETYNRVTVIDRWVVEHVLEWMSEHRDELDYFGGFAINVSGHSVNDETFADFVLDQFSRCQAPTSKVCFEITETAAIANLDNARDFMNRMKIIGCRFSLDDFGTGLSSYSYLRNLPVDFVKIDGVFVKDLASSPGDYAVVRSINEIGHYMGKKTIAEFVEDDEILAQLREIGVDFAQGYGIEKPLLLSELRIPKGPLAAA